jgi:hypothetical protein
MDKAMRLTVTQWREQLAGVPSLFGRLIYFAGLRDHTAGQYLCSDLECSSSEQDRIIREAHAEAFYSFLALPLSRIAEDLVPYLETFERSPRLEDLVNDLIPPDVGLESVLLFVGTVEVILSLANRQRGSR